MIDILVRTVVEYYNLVTNTIEIGESMNERSESDIVYGYIPLTSHCFGFHDRLSEQNAKTQKGSIMPSGKNYKRDYKQEARTAKKRGETGSGSKSGDATRHRARRKVTKARGKAAVKGKDVDHKVPLRSSGSNSLSNLRIRSKSVNRSEGGKVKNRRKTA